MSDLVQIKIEIYVRDVISDEEQLLKYEKEFSQIIPEYAENFSIEARKIESEEDDNE